MLLLRILFCLALAAPSSAETAVYHSPNDDGAPGPTLVPPSGTQSVYLYVDGGAVASAGGTACDEGQGDEVCGFDLEITPQFGLTFGAFNAEVGADLVVNFDATSLRINGLDSQAPAPGPHRVGELVVNAVSGGEVHLSSGEVVGADLDSEVLAGRRLVTAPEPGAGLLLASGVALLWLLPRRRT